MLHSHLPLVSMGREILSTIESLKCDRREFWLIAMQPRLKDLMCQGVQMQPERANEFQGAILDGKFDEAILLLPNLIQSHHALKQVSANAF